jgi:hypothetical protein
MSADTIVTLKTAGVAIFCNCATAVYLPTCQSSRPPLQAARSLRHNKTMSHQTPVPVAVIALDDRRDDSQGCSHGPSPTDTGPRLHLASCDCPPNAEPPRKSNPCCVGYGGYEGLSDRRQHQSPAAASQSLPNRGIDPNRLNPVFPDIHEGTVMLDSAIPEQLR